MKAQQMVKIEPTQGVKQLHIQLNQPFQISYGPSSAKPMFSASTSGWTNVENAKYIVYVLHNKNSFENRAQNKLWGLYQQMSFFIGSRNFRQCKNYHTKLCHTLGNIDKIVQFFENNIENFQKLLLCQLQNLKKFNSKRISQKSQSMDLNSQPQSSKQNLSKNLFRPTADEYIKPNQNINQNYQNLPQMQMRQTPIQMVPIGMINNRQIQWVQCHRLFLEWTTRLRQLQQMGFMF